MSIKNRLEKIKYQQMRDYVFSDIEKIKAVQSIYDAAVDTNTDISDANLPTEVLGVTLEWSADNKSLLKIDSGLYEIFNDSLTDNNKNSLGDQLLSSAFVSNNEFFYTNNQILEIRR